MARYLSHTAYTRRELARTICFRLSMLSAAVFVVSFWVFMATESHAAGLTMLASLTLAAAVGVYGMDDR